MNISISFLTKDANCSCFLTYLLSSFKFFDCQRQENLIMGWIISYWKFFICHGIGFNFWISQILAIFLNKFAFSGFWKLLSFFQFLQFQGPGNLLWGLLIGHCIVSSNNRMVFNFLMSRILMILSFWYSSILTCKKSYSAFWWKSYCMVFSFNGFLFNNLTFWLLEVFLIEFAIYSHLYLIDLFVPQ